MRTYRIMALALMFSATASVAAADCGGIPSLDSYPDGTWLFRSGSGWKPVADLNRALADWQPRRVSFAYIARDEGAGPPRAGVLVVKAGVRVPRGNAATSEPPSSGEVTLMGRYDEAAECRTAQSFPRTKVRSRSYDDYHDRGTNVPERAQLENFHIGYRTATGCRRSNDVNMYVSIDGASRFRVRSNRSQFSFDPSVVAAGQYRQFLSFFRPASAHASEGLFDQRVEIKRYQLPKAGAACVRFHTRLVPGAFVRIVDLERRTPLPTPEQSWSWSN